MPNCNKCGNTVYTLTIKHNGFFIMDGNSIAEALSSYMMSNEQYIQMNICDNCGTVQKNIIKEEPVVEKEIEYIGDYIQKFYICAQKREDRLAEDILKKLSIRISPYDYDALAEGYTKFCCIRHIEKYPEFDELIDLLLPKYKNVEFQEFIKPR